VYLVVAVLETRRVDGGEIVHVLWCWCIAVVLVDIYVILSTVVLQITTAQEDRRDDEKLYHKVSLRELQTMSPFVSFIFTIGLTYI